MQSKRSFFNVTLFQKHLSRFWPLWGIMSLVGAMFPLYLQLTLMQYGGDVSILTTTGEFRYTLYQLADYFVPAFVCAYAILCVMAVWGYLYNARSVGMMHTLPVDRTCLFVTNTLAAMAMQVIPFAVTGGLLCLIALGWGFFDLIGVLNTVLAVLFCILLFTGIGTLCAMLTGHAFVLPVFYLLANFLAFMLEMLVTNLSHLFLIGVPMLEDIGHLSILSPIVKLYNSVDVYIERPAEGVMIPHLRGLWVVALYALAGAALLALSWFLYRKRHSESAGDVVAFRWLRPIFRYGIALLSGLTVGRLLYEALWREIFQRGDYADPLPMAVCLFLAGLLGYYAASMLLEKSRRVFGKKSLLGVGIVAAGAAAVCLLVSVDLFGLEKRIPAWDEIESVSIEDRGVYSEWDAEAYPDQARALRDFHQAIIDDLDYIRSYVPDWTQEHEDRVFSHYIYLRYYLKDGTALERQYNIWMTADRAEIAGTFENLLNAFYQDPEVRAYDVRIPTGTTLDSIDIHSRFMSGYVNTRDHADGSNQETEQLYAALQKDADEGNIPAKDIMQYYEGWFYNNSFYFRVNYRGFDKEDGGYYYRVREVYIAPTMTNTLSTLVELGYLTEEDVAEWKKERAEAMTGFGLDEMAWAEENAVYPEEAMVSPD